jgi:hypothetical protein
LPHSFIGFIALLPLAGGEHALWRMLVRLAEFGKATRGERAEEIVCYYRAHPKYLFAEGRDLLFCFLWSANFRERKDAACSNPTMGCWFTEL